MMLQTFDKYWPLAGIPFNRRFHNKFHFFWKIILEYFLGWLRLFKNWNTEKYILEHIRTFLERRNWHWISNTSLTPKIKLLRSLLYFFKKAPFFISQAPTCYSFIFNFWFLYWIKHTFCHSKSACRIFRFRLRFIFIKA